MRQLFFLMALLYAVQACSSNPGLAFLPIAHYLKTDLGLSVVQLAGFQAIVMLPWLFKPVFGLVVDSVMVLGYRFKGYLMLCYAWVILIFMGLGWIGEPGYGVLLGGGIAVSIAIAFSDVVADKLMIDRGKATQMTGQLQAAQWAGLGFSAMAMFLLGGWLADHAALSTVFGLSMVVPGLALVAVGWGLRERRSGDVMASWRGTWRGLWQAGRDRRFLVLLGLIVLLGFSPVPPTYFYERDVLRFSNEFVGQLGAWAFLGTGMGALGFRGMSRWVSGRWLVHGMIGLQAIAGLSYLFLQGQGSAIGVYLFNGVSGILATLCLFELVVQHCVDGAEGTIYAVALAISNFAKSMGGVLGSVLYDRGVNFSALVILGAVATAGCWLLLPVLQFEEKRENSF